LVPKKELELEPFAGVSEAEAGRRNPESAQPTKDPYRDKP